MTAAPRLSILIPNYNNGRRSARDGRRDFIGDLLQSIEQTLRDDPTPVELLIADDGSTDDSRYTIRHWMATAGWAPPTDFKCRDLRRVSKATWPASAVPDPDHGIRPWRSARFIELEHRGIVSRCMNHLLREARGEVLCRFDGDIILHTQNWASILCEKFDRADASVGIIGAKQLTINGRIHSMGDWILHPRGYHHVGQGAPRDAFAEDVEVDHVMGCFYACRRAVYEEVGAYDETIMRGQTIDWTVAARSRGWRVICTPDIEFTHCHSERAWRDNAADTPAGLNSALNRFHRKWGFDRLAPDLDAAASMHDGSPLLWNRNVFNDRLARRFDRAFQLEGSSWARVATDSIYQQSIAKQVRVIIETAVQLGVAGGPIAHVNCCDGLLTHLLAEQGLALVGFDENPNALRLARHMSEKGAHARNAPRFTQIRSSGSVSANLARSFDAALFADLHLHPNPTALLHAAARMLRPAGRLIVLARELGDAADDLGAPAKGYRAHELNAQIVNSRRFRLASPAQPRGDGSLLAIATPVEFGSGHGHFTEVKRADSAQPSAGSHLTPPVIGIIDGGPAFRLGRRPRPRNAR